MGSKTFDGVRFAAYSKDHPPPHVHGFYAEVEVIIELVIAERGTRVAKRKDCIQPPSAKRSDVNRIRKTASEHFKELVALWEAAQ